MSLLTERTFSLKGKKTAPPTVFIATSAANQRLTGIAKVQFEPWKAKTWQDILKHIYFQAKTWILFLAGSLRIRNESSPARLPGNRAAAAAGSATHGLGGGQRPGPLFPAGGIQTRHLCGPPGPGPGAGGVGAGVSDVPDGLQRQGRLF